MWRQLLGVCLCIVVSGVAVAGETNPARRSVQGENLPVYRVIVKWKDDATNKQILSAEAQKTADADRARGLGQRSGVPLSQVRQLAPRMHLLAFDHAMAGAELQQALARLRADSAVLYAEPDRKKFALAVPNDPLFPGQWYLQNGQPAAINAVGAWDVTTGSTGTVVAVLDTGIRPEHPDLAGKILPGYDFVSADAPGNFSTANDGDGRDPDPSDPGDWVTDAEAQTPSFSGCTVSDSSWHGTKVAGVATAQTGNAVGIAGVSWGARILPVRVLGKCGGYNSDIIDAMRWAAGLAVSGVPNNPTRADVINMSLGSTNGCSAAYQDAVNEVTAAGSLVVVSAGNETGPVDEPGNCAGVLAVAGVRHVGTKVGYSSFGAEVGISAPAGNCVNTSGPCLFPINTTTDAGTTVPAGSTYTDENTPTVGTSFSAPQASGVAALMWSVNPYLLPSEIISRMKEGATPFPTPTGTLPLCSGSVSANDPNAGQCECTTSTCGAGMLNARGAVLAALRPVAQVAGPSTIAGGQSATFDATASFDAGGNAVASYSWRVLNQCGAAVSGLSSTTQPKVTFTPPASGTFTVELTVTDASGRADTSSFQLVVAPGGGLSPTACSSGGGGGGGGSADPVALVGLLAAVLALGRARRRS